MSLHLSVDRCKWVCHETAIVVEAKGERGFQDSTSEELTSSLAQAAVEVPYQHFMFDSRIREEIFSPLISAQWLEPAKHPATITRPFNQSLL